jgi:hypothetical protein
MSEMRWSVLENAKWDGAALAMNAPKPLYPRKIIPQRTASSICLPTDGFMNDAG